MNAIDTALAKVDKRIAELQNRINIADAQLSIPFQSIGAFVTGRSNRSKSLDRKVDAENNRRARLFSYCQWATREVKRLSANRSGYLAGECWLDGQRRALSPSRQRADTAEAKYAQWVRSIVKPGQLMAVSDNPVNSVRIKRLSRKSITSDGGTLWRYFELLPMRDGRAMTGQEIRDAMKRSESK